LTAVRDHAGDPRSSYLGIEVDDALEISEQGRQAEGLPAISGPSATTALTQLEAAAYEPCSRV
jgi:hypothetical protein